MGTRLRIFALGLGALLLLSGGVLVVLADQERQAAVAQAQQNVDDLERSLADSRRSNLLLAEALSTLRSAIADQEDLLADTAGFLE